MAAGNKHLEYKGLLNDMEVASPGAKHAFYFGFLDRAASLFADSVVEDNGGADVLLSPCSVCGSPSTNDTCSFCKLVGLAGARGRSENGVQVEIGSRPDMIDE